MIGVTVEQLQHERATPMEPPPDDGCSVRVGGRDYTISERCIDCPLILCYEEDGGDARTAWLWRTHGVWIHSGGRTLDRARQISDARRRGDSIEQMSRRYNIKPKRVIELLRLAEEGSQQPMLAGFPEIG